MAVLCHLAERAGTTVSREQLLDAIWKTRHVVEDVLTRRISQLRQLLGDDARDSRYIQTIPKVGYRLLITPEPLAEATAQATPVRSERATSLDEGTRARPWIRWAAVFVASLSILAGVYLVNSRQQVADNAHLPGVTIGPDTPCVAILPFVVVGETHGADAFADGMTDDIIQLLGTVPGLRVMSRTSSFHFKGSNDDLSTIAGALNVQHVLEGSVQLTGDRIRIKAQLIDARTDLHLWSQEFDRELVDLFDVQKEIAVAVARRFDLSVDARFMTRGAATRNMAAYQLYVEGRMAMDKYTESAARDSIAMLDAASKLDPDFARAWSSLAVARWVSPASTPNMTQEQILASDELARAAANRAIGLDRSMAEAQFVLADSARVGYAHAEAEMRYRAALAAIPNDPALHVGYGNVLSDAGLIRNSLTHRQLASGLDPLSPVTAFFLARSTLLAGDDDAAREQLRRSRGLGFQNAVLHHMEAYLHARRKNWQAAGAIWAETDEEVERKAMEEVFAALENPARYPAALAAIKELPPWNVLPFRGRLYAALLLGDEEVAWAAAFEGVEMRLEPTDIWWLPEAEILRTDERFEQLAQRLNLLPYWQEYGWPEACNDSRTRLPCG